MRMRVGRLTKTCARCGSAFECMPSKPNRIYCSTACAGNRPAPIGRQCLYCGAAFAITRARSDTAKWCRRACYEADRVLRPAFQPGYKGQRPEAPPVLHAGPPGPPPRRREAQRAGQRRIGTTYQCPSCNGAYALEAAKQRRCHPCQAEVRRRREYANRVRRRLERGEFVVGYSTRHCAECGEAFIPTGHAVTVCDACKAKRKGAGRQLLKQPKPCEVCGWSHTINRHRIVPGNQGGAYTPGNVMWLCANHHSALHAGLARIEPDRRYVMLA